MHRASQIARLTAFLVAMTALGVCAAEARYGSSGGGRHASYGGRGAGYGGGRGFPRAQSVGGYGRAVGHYPPQRPPVGVAGHGPYPGSPPRGPRPPYPDPSRVPPRAPIGGRPFPVAGRTPVNLDRPFPRPITSYRFIPPPLLRTVSGAQPNFVVPGPAEHRYAEREILVLIRGGSLQSLRSIEGELRLTPVGVAQIGLLDGALHRYRLGPDADLASTIATLRSRGVIAAAEPNFRFKLEGDVDANVAYQPIPATTSEMPPQYAVEALNLNEAHTLSQGNGVRVAIIDSGLDETNPEVSGRVADRFDALGGVFTPHRHGTAMGGAIVAHRNLVGIAPKAQLIAIRAFSGTGATAGGLGFDILRGFQFAVEHGARVVNMSFAGPQDQLLKDAIAEARRQGVVVVAAAGNGGPQAAPQYPAAEPGVIAVTATDASGAAFAGANRGAYIALAAPGVQILAPSLGNAVQICSGTSIATAEVSGIVALLLERNATANPDEIRRHLSLSAHPLAVERAAGGAGIVDAAAAIRYATAR